MRKKSPVQGKKRGTGGPVSAKRGSMKDDPMDQFMKKGKAPSSLAPKSKSKGKGGPVYAAKGSMKDDPMDKFMKSGKAPRSLAPKIAKTKGPKPRLVSAKKGSMKDDPMDKFMKKGKAPNSLAPKGKRTRSFSESKVKRDNIGRFAGKSSSRD